MTQAGPAAAGADPPGGILFRLRSESRQEHAAIEQALDLTGPGLTLATYHLRLEQLYGFYAPLEDRLGALGAFSGQQPRPQRKAPLLVTDLLALGVAAPERLQRCQALQDVDGPAQMLGSLYVLEGATLGGQIISRHLRRTLCIGPDNGGRFFQGYGDETGARWRAFGTALTAFAAEQGGQDAMVRAAIGTFRALRLWCQRDPAPV